MAGEDNLLNRLVSLLSSFDDSSWEALSSKGLLRRARKDLERITVEVIAETAGTLQVSVPPFVVSMPASGPAKATCTCPSPGVCQHILIAGLFLQSYSTAAVAPKEPTTADSIRTEVSLLTPEILKSWVGSTDYRKGVALFEKNSMPPVIQYEDTVIIRLLPSGIEVRFVPGSGLDGMFLPRRNGKSAAVAAMLALRKSLGLEIPVAAAQQSLVDLSGTPRSKKEILDSACAVLEDAVAVGLSHVSPILAERLVTLGVSAQGARLPRVSLALRTLADEVRSILRREARADEDRLLTLMARVYALMDAIRFGSDQQTMELAGSSRGLYVEVPEMDLAGVGAYTWQTGSGYVGLTVLFWANQTREFLSWSYARPEIQRADARQRFYGEGPWDGTQSPRQVATSRLKLRNGRRTANGRLSSSTQTSALVLGATDPELLDFQDRVFTSWTRLRAYVASHQPLGFREPNPLDMVVVVVPTRFGNRSFDPISQTFTWETFDVANEALTLSLPFRDWTEQSIRTLEELSPSEASHWRLIVRLVYEDEALSVEPISILRPEVKANPVFQLAFDSFGEEQSRVSVATSSDTPDIEEIEISEDETSLSEAFIPSSVALGRVLSELNDRLLAIAEAGAQKGLSSQRQWFTQSTSEVYSLGLTALARSLSTLGQADSGAAVILKTRYLAYLHAQATAHLFH